LHVIRVRIKHKPALIHYHFAVFKLGYQGAGGNLDVADPPLLGDASGFYYLILVAFITGNSSLEPLIEGLYAQIHENLR